MSCAQVLVLWPSDSNRYLSLLDQTRDSKHVSFTISFYMTLQAWFVDCFFPNSSTQWQVLSVLMNGTLKSQLYFYSRLIWHVNVIVGWGGGFFGWVTIVFSRRTLVSGVCCISVRADCKYLSDCAIYTLWQCRCCVWTRLCQSSYIHLIDKWSFWCSQHCEDWCLLRWDGILFKDPATSFTRIDECVCCSLFIYPDDDSRRLPWNIHTLLPHYTVLHCRKPCSLQSLPCKLQTSQSPFFFFRYSGSTYVCNKNLYFITDYILKPVLSSCVVIKFDYSNQIAFATLILLFLFVSLKRLQPDTSQLQEQQKGKLSCYSSLARPYATF